MKRDCSFIRVLLAVLVIVATSFLLLEYDAGRSKRAMRARVRAMDERAGQLKTIGLAMFRYHEATGTFPYPFDQDEEANPVGHWQERIFPYVVEEMRERSRHATRLRERLLSSGDAVNEDLRAEILEYYSFRVRDQDTQKGCYGCYLPVPFRGMDRTKIFASPGEYPVMIEWICGNSYLAPDDLLANPSTRKENVRAALRTLEGRLHVLFPDGSVKAYSDVDETISLLEGGFSTSQ